MNFLQQSPYLREQRKFPYGDVRELANQSDHAYIDIAQKMNAREIGLYATGFQIVNGQGWYLNGGNLKQQALRQVYQFTVAGNIPHGLNWASVSFISPNSYGTYTDGTNWYGVIYASSTAIAGQVSFYVTPTNIVVLVDAGAPVPTSGIINLEWVSQF